MQISLDMGHGSVIQISLNKTLIQIINENCASGTVFYSDSWKAYYKLPEQLDLEDVLNFTVNQTKNYVDPNTGAHTQSIEGP